MKNIALAVVCLFIVSITNAQSKFGIVNYTLPEGWYARKSGNDLVLERQDTENSGCSVTLFQEMDRAINTEKSYLELWALNTKSDAKPVTLIKTEGDGWTSFSGSKTLDKSTSASTEGFYTLSDGSKTVMILVSANSKECIDEVDSIIASISIPEKDSKSKTKAKKKGIRIAPLKTLKAIIA